MRFEIEEYVIEDAAGGVTGVRIEWREARIFIEWLIVRIGFGFFWLCFACAVFSVPMGALHGAEIGVPLLLVSIGSFAVAWQIWAWCWRVPGRRRWIEFGRDGTISSTEHAAWRTPVSDIGNIEWEQIKQRKSEEDLPYTHGVRILTKRGRVIHLAKNLEPDDAAHLAAVLMSAREAVKFVDLRGVTVPDAAMVY